MSDEIPAEVGRGSATEYAAAAHLLNHSGLVRVSKGHLYPEQNGIAWGPILDAADTLSDGEHALLGFAVTLWTGRQQELGGIMDVLRRCDSSAVKAAVDALQVRAGLMPVEDLG